MKLNSLIRRIGFGASFLRTRKGQVLAPPTLGSIARAPYGPFRFKTELPKGLEYTVLTSTDLRTWTPGAKGVAGEGPVEVVDSEAFKFPYRFYRLLAGEVFSSNVIGYASLTLPPGFSMIANPFEASSTVSDLFKGWPDGTSLNRFDTGLFRLAENVIKNGKWIDPVERLAHGEGAIFFNPTTDYRSVNFAGEVIEGSMMVPIPAGFSLRSSLVPQPGNLVDDLGFPVAEGDVIHLFDRERQKYMLHPYENGRWTAGPPILSVGEAFWVAKTEAGNWIRNLVIGDSDPERNERTGKPT